MTVYLYQRLATAHIEDLMADAANARLARRADRRHGDRRRSTLRRITGWLGSFGAETRRPEPDAAPWVVPAVTNCATASRS